MSEKPSVDVTVHYQGSVTGLEPHSDEARCWIAENLPEDAPTLGAIVYIETRYVGPIIDGLVGDGLVVS